VTTGSQVTIDTCILDLVSTNANNRIIPTSNASAYGELRNCEFQFSSTGQGFNAQSKCAIKGGVILADTEITTLLATIGTAAECLIEGIDLTNVSSSVNIGNSTLSDLKIAIRNCKLPSSWTGSLNASVPGSGADWTLQNVDSTDSNYRSIRQNMCGTLTSETTVVKNGGASDGTTALSWRMETNADAEWNHLTLDSSEIVRWNETIDSPITITVDFLHDGAQGGSPSVPLTDRDIWLEVQYLGTSGFPLSLFATDAASSGSPYESNYLATAMDQETSSAIWTTTGMSNPITQKLSVTITPREKGFIHGVVKMAKASYTCYVDPVLQVS